MKKRFWCILLFIIVLANVFAIPLAAAETETASRTFTYEEGSFYPTQTVQTVEHNLGYIPDIVIVYTSQVPEDGSMFLALGFSEAMLSALGGGYKNFSSMVSDGAAFQFTGDRGIESASTTNGEKYGFIRAATESTFVIGGSMCPLATTGLTYGGEECGGYQWIAISGVVGSSSDEYVYSDGSFYSTETTQTVTHNFGCIPEIVIVYTSQVPEDGSMFLTLGFSEAMLSALGGGYKNFSSMVSDGAAFQFTGNRGIELASTTNGEKYGFIRAATESTFVIGGSMCPLATTGLTYGGEECGGYQMIAISGVSFTDSGSDHTHEYTSVVTPPTCVAGGYTTHTCSCGDTYTDTVTAATGHAWSEPVLVEPTCTADGSSTKTCTSCGAEQAETLTAVGHDYASGVCVICGEKDPDASESGGTDPDASDETSISESVSSDSGGDVVDPEPPESSASSSIESDPDSDPSASGETVAPDTQVSDSSNSDLLVPGGVHSAPVKAKEKSDVAPAVMLMGAVCAFIVIYSALEPSDSGSRRRRRR